MFTQRSVAIGNTANRNRRQTTTGHDTEPPVGYLAASGGVWRRSSGPLAAIQEAPSAGSSHLRRRRGRRTTRKQHWQPIEETGSSSSQVGPVWAKYLDEAELASSSSSSLNSAMALPMTAPAATQSRLTAHLHIDSLSSEDNGLYSCRVDFRKARSRTQETLLKIIGKF